MPWLPRSPSWSVRAIVAKQRDPVKGVEFDASQVARLARLANITISPSEEEKVTRDINALRRMIDPITRVDTAGVEPLVSLVRDCKDHKMREDVARDPVVDERAGEDGELFGRQLTPFSKRTEGGYYVRR
ncbi:hypothetical protein HK101_002630 [Irineochytrium annulatum]|nr:hypothetical protein HK101_002630 [Irineochytrium annulatum]